MWLLSSASAFHPPAANLAYRPRHASGLTPRRGAPGGDLSRRQTTALALAALTGSPAIARADSYAYQPALAGKDYGKSEMGGGADFIKTPSGLSYKDGTVGKGKTPAPGDRVVIDWTGYTIGYFGRPFETKKLREIQGDEKDYLRFVLGQKPNLMIPALEEGLATMAEGGVRQLIVPPSIGYPKSDMAHETVGPKPTTFSGQRALNFVLENQELIDKTLLFNVKLVRVDEADGKGGFKSSVQDKFK
jgi:hypothetical protein